MPGTVIRGGLVIDRTGERRADVAVAPDGRIAAVAPDLDLSALGLDDATELDGGGCVVAPGLVDIHTHLREPGREEAETVETGSRGRRPRRLHGAGGHAQHRAGHRFRRRGSVRSSTPG